MSIFMIDERYVGYDYYDDYPEEHGELRIDLGYFPTREAAEARIETLGTYRSQYDQYVEGAETGNAERQQVHDYQAENVRILREAGREVLDVGRPYIQPILSFDEWLKGEGREYYVVVEIPEAA